MERAKTTRGDLPQQVAEKRVAGCKHAYYELSDGDFLVVAGQQAVFQAAVDNLDRLDAPHVTEILRSDPENARAKLGLKDALIFWIEPRPEDAASITPEEHARKLSLEAFPPADPQPGAEPEEEPEEEDGDGDDGDSEPGDDEDPEDDDLDE